MSASVFLAVLAAALMHAGWNAMLKVRLGEWSGPSEQPAEGLRPGRQCADERHDGGHVVQAASEPA